MVEAAPTTRGEYAMATEGSPVFRSRQCMGRASAAAGSVSDTLTSVTGELRRPTGEEASPSSPVSFQGGGHGCISRVPQHDEARRAEILTGLARAVDDMDETAAVRSPTRPWPQASAPTRRSPRASPRAWRLSATSTSEACTSSPIFSLCRRHVRRHRRPAAAPEG